MKKLVVSNHPPRRLTVLAALLAALAAAQPALAAPADVVISQLYGAGGNNGAAWNRDFIELFNRSSGPVSLSGMSVQYQSATGTTWQATALPNVTLQPGQYFLVGGASGGSAGTDIGPVDQAGTLNLSATTGKVALSRIAAAMSTADGAPNVIDLVGFGGANRFETAVAPAPSNTTSIQRAALGCTDTDNNAADFSAGPVAGPRRSTSPANACGGGGGPVLQPIVPNCPASLQARQGSASSAALSATDQDSIVNSAVISAGAAPGITLAGFAPATGPGAAASVTLQVGASVAAGTYPVVVQFGNDSAQSASCTVSVRVAGTLAIPQIQGSAATSPYANTVQTTQGVVTAKISGGFFIQDLNGDGDPGTSDGLFVFGASTEWHNNADEPDALDYNLGDTPQDPYVKDPFRASDHDPVVVSLNLTPTFVDVGASVKIAQSGLTVNRLTGKYTGTVSFTNTSGAAINGPLQFVLQGLTAGVTLDNKSGDQNGSPYITLPNASIGAGATVSVTTTFTNPSKASIGYTPTLFSGTF